MNLINWTLLYFGKAINKKASLLQNVIDHQATKIKRQQDVINALVLKNSRQTTRIRELEALYAGTVESKNHKTLQEKYMKLKQKLEWLKIRYEEWDE